MTLCDVTHGAGSPWLRHFPSSETRISVLFRSELKSWMSWVHSVCAQGGILLLRVDPSSCRSGCRHEGGVYVSWGRAGRNVKSCGHTGSGPYRNHLLVLTFSSHLFPYITKCSKKIYITISDLSWLFFLLLVKILHWDSSLLLQNISELPSLLWSSPLLTYLFVLRGLHILTLYWHNHNVL